MTIVAAIGAKSLFLLYGWLISAIVCSYLSERKGYGERPGLASGLLLHVLGLVIWLVWPARPDSKWKRAGIFGGHVKERPPSGPGVVGGDPAAGKTRAGPPGQV